MMSSMGHALRELRGDENTYEGPIEVMMRAQDFNTPEVSTPQGPVSVPAQALIAFTGTAFRELSDTDTWEFRTGEQRMFVSGRDILFVRVPRRVV